MPVRGKASMANVVKSEAVICRPSWIWDSRAPFHNFFQENARFNRQTGSLIVSAEAAAYYLKMPSNVSRGVQKTLHVDKGTYRAGRAWMMFERSTNSTQSARDPSRDPELFLNAIAEAQQFVHQATLVAYSSMFEAYILCWSLNYLLASLEAGLSLGKQAAGLVQTFL